MKYIKLGLGVAFLLIFIAAVFFISQRMIVKQEIVGEAEPVLSTTTLQPGEQKIANNLVPLNITFTSSSFVLGNDWILDTYDYQDQGPYVIFAAYKPVDKYYGIFRFDRSTNEVKTFYSQVKQMGHLGYKNFNQFSGSGIDISPDEKTFFFAVSPTFYFFKNVIVMDIDGKEVSFAPPQESIGLDWFTNTQLSYRPPKLYDVEQFIEIIDLNTGVKSKTKIAVNDGLLNHIVNPASTAVVVTEARQGSFFGKEYNCGGFYSNMVVYSYPDGKELLRVNDLHYAAYRWLEDGRLQYAYHKIEEADLEDGCKNMKRPATEAFYTPTL